MSSEQYKDIFTNDGNFKIYIKKNQHNLIDLEFTYKYKIMSQYLNHCIELFPIKHNDFMTAIVRFHLPCVRGYYDGTNVYLTPSCICAHMTYMNMDYKYVSGSKDPIDIINKYRLRGFGIWLNENEKRTIVQYNKNTSFWKTLYGIDKSTTDMAASVCIFSSIDLNNRFFRPRLYNIDYYLNTAQVDLNNRYKNNTLPINTNDIHQLLVHCKNIPGIDYGKFIVINSSGTINPVKTWVIETTWELYELNNTKN